MNTKIQRFISFIIIFGFIFAFVNTSAFASGTMPVNEEKNKTAEKIEKFYNEKKKGDREKLFVDLVKSSLNYVTVRSLSGKSGDWIAFVDIYQEYEEGKEQKKFVLQGGTLQYGLKALPTTAESSTLIIGKTKQKVDADKKSSFSFETTPTLTLASSALKDICRVTVSSGKDSASINLNENFPSKSISEFETALTSMSEQFYEYLQKEKLEGFSFNHSFMRLKSFIKDLDKMERGYSWELVLVEDEKLPSESLIIRFDCETEKTSIVSRETRAYFN